MNSTTAFYQLEGRLGIQASTSGMGCAAVGSQFYCTEVQPAGWDNVGGLKELQGKALPYTREKPFRAGVL